MVPSDSGTGAPQQGTSLDRQCRARKKSEYIRVLRRDRLGGLIREYSQVA
jgi:hypothetical protein